MRTSNSVNTKKETKSLIYLIIGSVILLFLAISFFVNVTVEAGANYVVNSKLLYSISFYNPFLLGFYFLVGIAFLISGIRLNRKE